MSTERQLRATARRQGLVLRKSRSRTPEHQHWGTYQLVDDRNGLVVGDQNTGFGMSLDDIAQALDG